MERTRAWWDEAKASFGALPALALVAGVVVGVGVPYVDEWLSVELPVVEFAGEDAARGMLETIATVTVSVAGLAFSVTLVTLTLASSQLSPRVLRSFQGDRLSQATLALFLGTFIYCIVVLLRLGETQDQGGVPNLSVTIAAVLALASFALFAWFLHHIVRMLQPATVIRRIERDAASAIESRYPHGVGREPEDEATAHARLDERRRACEGRSVLADSSGYITQVRAGALVRIAARHDGVVVQVARAGEYVVPGDVLATLHLPGDEGGDGEEDGDESAPVDQARGCFALDDQRTALQDPGFPIRQLADIALKGLSPGINDPTTAENAIDALTASLVRFAESPQPSLVRVDDDGDPRLLAAAPTLDDLIRVGFAQVRVFAAPYPIVAIRLLELLARIERAAAHHGVEAREVARQARLLREGPEGEVPTEGDVESVRAAHDLLHDAGAAGSHAERLNVRGRPGAG